MPNSIPFYRHQLSDTEVKAAQESLKGDILTSGAICKGVESQLEEYFNVKHAKLVNSWTNGALAALMAFEIGPGDEVIIPSMTFIACANIVELLGATPVFCDVNPETLLVDADLIRPHVTDKTRVIMLVHLYGQMCDVKQIRSEFPNPKIKILEDCAHSFESNRDGYQPGQHSDVAIFSFYATKNVTCGEGGAIITNDTKLHESLIQRVLHGMTAGAADRFKTGSYQHWNMNLLGIKANLSDILASLLPSQIASADAKLNQRLELVESYDTAFSSLTLKFPKRLLGAKHAHHLYPIWVPPNKRDQVLKKFAECGVGVTVNFRPVHEMNYYATKYPANLGNFPVSSKWGGGVLSIPLYPGLTKSDQERIIHVTTHEIEPIIILEE